MGDTADGSEVRGERGRRRRRRGGRDRDDSSAPGTLAEGAQDGLAESGTAVLPPAPLSPGDGSLPAAARSRDADRNEPEAESRKTPQAVSYDTGAAHDVRTSPVAGEAVGTTGVAGATADTTSLGSDADAVASEAGGEREGTRRRRGGRSRRDARPEAGDELAADAGSPPMATGGDAVALEAGDGMTSTAPAADAAPRSRRPRAERADRDAVPTLPGDPSAGSHRTGETADVWESRPQTALPAADTADEAAAAPMPASTPAPASASASLASAPSLSSAPAPVPASAAVVAPVTAAANPPAPFALDADRLRAVAEAAGLQWVGSDAGKVQAAQQTLAHEAPPVRAAREPKTVAPVDQGPLVLIETRKDLSQVTLPFETERTPNSGS